MQMNSGVTIERKRVDCSALPKGWQREEVLRKSGITAGKVVDVYYYSPTGKRIESKPQLARHIGDSLDMSSFDFQTGKLIQQHHLPQPALPLTLTLPPPSISLYRCSGGGVTSSSPIGAGAGSGSGSNGGAIAATSNNSLKRKYKSLSSSTSSSSLGGACGGSFTAGGSPSAAGGAPVVSAANLRQQLEFSRALRTDISLVPPIRQTASIFKQPVTVVRNHENNKVRHDTKHGAQEKPKQLFWEKRLERLRSCHSTGEEFDDIALPRGIRSVGPQVNEQTVLQSLATALHVLNTPVTGQTSTKTEMTKNATAFINPEQPLMQAVLISEEDIRRQEERVSAARRKLQDALKV